LPRAKFMLNRYFGPWKRKEKSIGDLMALMISNFRRKVKYHQSLDIPPIPIVDADIPTVSSESNSYFTWMGHSSCYVQLGGKHFLTDPMWSARACPFNRFGPYRYIRPPVPLEDIAIDYVLLSHTHYDHFDYPSARRIGNRAKWIVPKGVKELLGKLNIDNVVELDWWESHIVDDTMESSSPIEIVFTPAKHWTCRSLFDNGTCLWGSFAVLAKNGRFFFGGDTAYCSVFKQIGEMYGPFDLAAIPVGAYLPRWFMKDLHCDPTEAVKIHQDLCAKQSVGIHWGTFKLTEEENTEPALELARARAASGVSNQQFFTMAHGETVSFGSHSLHDFATLYPHLYESYLVHREDEVEET